MDKKDDLLIFLSKDFNIEENFFDKISEKLGITLEETLNLTLELKNEGKIKRIAPILRHEKTDFQFNVMVAWKINSNQEEEFLKSVMKSPLISHIYKRKTQKDWDLNLFTMIHSKSQEEINKIINNIKSKFLVEKIEILPTKKQFKKTSPDLEKLLK